MVEVIFPFISSLVEMLKRKIRRSPKLPSMVFVRMGRTRQLHTIIGGITSS